MARDPGAVRAVLWDMGGGLTTSPFEAFARYERERGLPPDFLSGVNATNPDDNAWARLERGELDPLTFDAAFAAESAAAGHAVEPEIAAVRGHFDVVCQSSEMGSRKPELEFYPTACARAAVDPSEAVFLDDLVVNLEPARAMGMRTIKVETPERALDELAAMTGWPVAAVDRQPEAPTHG